ncbi:unnamed protein product [Schistocephalus solidus]|uniref:Spindle and centriole-associated protein 1 n=1 Tax=Schistocephalus solidus TaxID=70667 RepID=A0A183SCW4_SCHSO|nr:unnamed protein product [Schistocephalus solidus]
MGNKPSQVVRRPRLYRSQTSKADGSTKPHTRRVSNRIGVGDAANVDTLQIWDLNHLPFNDKQPKCRPQPLGDVPPVRSVASAKAQLTTYQRSCTYRRKLYSESLPKIKKVSVESCRSSARTPSNAPAGALPPLSNGTIMMRRPVPRERYYVDTPGNAVRPRTSCGLLDARSSTVSATRYACRPTGQQWNDNNWAENESTSSGTSNGCPVACSQTTPMALPQLTNLRSLLDRFEEEFRVSSTSLRQAMDVLVNNELLVGRSPADQRQLLMKSEESVVSVQALLAKMHQHIAQAHEFCNMLHRMDESLQTFAKAICAITAWEERQNLQPAPGRRVGSAAAAVAVPIALPRKTTDKKIFK